MTQIWLVVPLLKMSIEYNNSQLLRKKPLVKVQPVNPSTNAKSDLSSSPNRYFMIHIVSIGSFQQSPSWIW